MAASSAEEAIHAPGVDWVMVFSPNSCHRDHILAAFAAGKDVFAEKPLATTIDACKEISEAQRRSGRVFATGFVLRYAPIYRRAKELLDSGMFGRLLLIEGNENIAPDHGGYIMCNWRRLTKFAGPHILEKCCHDLDLINWFCGSLPSRVASFGGRDFFKPENNRLMEKYGEKTFKSWWDPHAQATPFTDDTDLMDNQVSIAEFRNRIRVTFTATMSNAIPERRLSFACAEGTMKLNLYSNIIRYRRLGDEGVTELNFSGDGHGGGDSYIMKELYETMSRGSRRSAAVQKDFAAPFLRWRSTRRHATAKSSIWNRSGKRSESSCPSPMQNPRDLPAPRNRGGFSCRKNGGEVELCRQGGKYFPLPGGAFCAGGRGEIIFPRGVKQTVDQIERQLAGVGGIRPFFPFSPGGVEADDEFDRRIPRKKSGRIVEIAEGDDVSRSLVADELRVQPRHRAVAHETDSQIPVELIRESGEVGGAAGEAEKFISIRPAVAPGFP
ncbi:MAG: Gfo/Idh/MocA family oxidoreductase [Lentisphaeria bacterium]|nr:MAG: Gfo/Idh/MocA family oxidoreductase [Lentisphaeria bacterium]